MRNTVKKLKRKEMVVGKESKLCKFCNEKGIGINEEKEKTRILGAPASRRPGS